MKLKLNFKPGFDAKAIKLDKTQSSLIATVVIAVVISVFCLTSAKVLLNQALYQRRVINARRTSAGQLNNDVKNANTLITQYNDVFLGNGATNVLGASSQDSQQIQGQTVPTSPPSGDNGRLVLDALPTTYDFPALLTSVSNLLNDDGVGGQSIGGTDQSTTVTSTPSSSPVPANIDLTVSGTTTYSGAEKLITDLERSIRPFDVTQITFSGNESSLTIGLNLTTYYQPAKTLILNSQEIK